MFLLYKILLILLVTSSYAFTPAFIDYPMFLKLLPAILIVGFNNPGIHKLLTRLKAEKKIVTESMFERITATIAISIILSIFFSLTNIDASISKTTRFYSFFLVFFSLFLLLEFVISGKIKLKKKSRKDKITEKNLMLFTKLFLNKRNIRNKTLTLNTDLREIFDQDEALIELYLSEILSHYDVNFENFSELVVKFTISDIVVVLRKSLKI